MNAHFTANITFASAKNQLTRKITCNQLLQKLNRILERAPTNFYDKYKLILFQVNFQLKIYFELVLILFHAYLNNFEVLKLNKNDFSTRRLSQAIVCLPK